MLNHYETEVDLIGEISDIVSPTFFSNLHPQCGQLDTAELF